MSQCINQHYCAGYNDAAQKANKVIAELETPWISVEDRLPEYGVNVFTWCEWRGPNVDYLKTSGKFTADHYAEGESIHHPVTHWQPITPPEESNG